MHAWDCGTPEQYPGWYRVVEYIPRANDIVANVFPPILDAARGSGMTVYHVVGGGTYYQQYPGYKRAVDLAGPTPSIKQFDPPDDPLHDQIKAFRAQHIHHGEHNKADIRAGFENLDFPEPARPQGDEGIAENDHQLLALCQADGINHLVYIGFAINWCLLMSPGGMLDMGRRGLMCSAIREAVTAVENKESARSEAHKEEALWRMALSWGFVFESEPFIAGISRISA
jgi:nicotinamidase-related amidase